MAGLDHSRDGPSDVRPIWQQRRTGHEDRIPGPGGERIAHHVFRQVQVSGGGKQAGEGRLLIRRAAERGGRAERRPQGAGSQPDFGKIRSQDDEFFRMSGCKFRRISNNRA